MPTTTTPQVRFRTIDGVRIRYADSGSPQKPAVVLTSPWPESVYAFAPIWASLAGHARLFAVDLPGFGASERREDLLSPRAMGDFLARPVAEADLGAPHIVAPDVGTAAALLRRPHTRSGARARPWAPAEPRFRSSSVSRWRRGCSTPTSTNTARWTRARSSALDTIAAGYPTTSARTTWPVTTAAAWGGESDG